MVGRKRQRQRHWASSASKMAVACSILPSVCAQAGLPDVAKCPSPPRPESACTEIETYDELRRLIGGNNGPKRVILCPFSVEPTGGDLPIRLQRRIIVACRKQNDNDECIIQGPGPHIEINGRRARVVLQGVTFVDDGNAVAVAGPAINVKKSGTKRPNLICECEFNNHRNGAIVASSRSVLYIASSSFSNGVGTAVFLGRKSFVSVYESTFVDNTASKPGVHIRAAASAELYIEGSTFTTTQERYPAVALGGRPSRFRDGGRNEVKVKSRRDILCIGAFLYLTNACIPFLGDEPKLLLSTGVDRQKAVFSPNADTSIIVGFSNARARPEDLIVVALSGSLEDQNYIYPREDATLVKRELCGTSNCRQPTQSGWIELNNLDLRAGEYKVYLLTKLVSGPNRPYSLIASTDSFVIEPPPFRAFRPGSATKSDSATGLRVAENINVRVLAETGRRVRYTSQEATEYESSLSFHSEPDGAAIFPMAGGGYVYMSNAELGDRRGGVFAVEFDRNGKVKKYEQRLRGTSYNCSGGSTSYGTYVSCEEWSGGMCWQVDPEGRRSPEVTNLVEPGNHEAMAQDNRDPKRPCFFVTEDHPYGALRRWCPDPFSVNLDPNKQWNMLHGAGARSYLEIYDGSNQFGWTDDVDRGRTSANKHFPGSEGIAFDGKGKLYVVSKTRKLLYSFDLDRMAFASESTTGGLFNGGNFEAEPDQISQFEPGDRYQYLTEDGGSSAGLFAREKATGNMYTLFYTNDSRYDTDEITGVALSPDGRFLYACVQERGYFLELSRSDGERFEGRTSNLKFHARHSDDNGGDRNNMFHSARPHG